MNTIELEKTSKDHELVFWVTGIKKAKDDIRAHIRHVYLKDNTITSTDGNRIHRVILDSEYPDGFYDVTKRTKSVVIMINKGNDMDYPKCEDILKPAPQAAKLTANLGTLHKSMAQIIRALPEDMGLNFYYLADVLNCDDVFDIFVGTERHPIVFTSGNKTAAIMPIRA